MKPMSGAKITFTKADLAHFSDAQKKVLYVFAHILNRTKLLEAQVFSQWRTAMDTQCSSIERDAAFFGVFEFLLLLAGELKEGWEAIQSCYYKTKLSQTLNPQLPADVQKILKRLSNHLSIIALLRNDFSYHHSPDRILTTAQLLEDNDSHTAYLFAEGNNYFDYATKLRIVTVAESLGLSDWRKVIEHLVNKIAVQVFDDFSTALNVILVTLVETIPHQNELVELPSVPSDKDLASHFFFYVIPRNILCKDTHRNVSKSFESPLQGEGKCP
jgi:hypothetical protein